MLINALSLKNFKCFEELDVKFAPITLLTGANSSGKSSLINAILAVLQTEQFPFYLSPNGKYINMGSFEEIVSNKFLSNLIEIRIESNSNAIINNFNTTWKLNLKTELPELNHIEFLIDTDWRVLLKEVNKKIDLSINIEDQQVHTLIRDFTQDWDIVRNLKPNSVLTLPPREQPWVPVDKEVTNSDMQFSSLGEAILWINSSPLTIRDAIENWVETMDNKFNYIGSFRQPPERTYYQKAKAQDKIDTDGRNYIDQIIEWEETNPEKLRKLNEIMRLIDIFAEIKSNKLKGGRFELNVKTSVNSDFASLVDVGFGISQFLPIIVADLQLSDDSCLAISQPEIHLHPKIQATFSNYLANQVKSTQKQYIVETHSEYLLNRIRLLLVTGELKPEDVRVLYFENDGIKSTVHDVEFATDGQIKGAPQGFFDTYGIDVMDIAMNAH